MSEKKVVRRSAAITLGIACILLIAGIGGAMAYYTIVINDKNTIYDNYASSHSHINSEYDDYVSNHTHTNSEYNSLQSDYNNYVANHHHTDSEYDSLSLQNTNLNDIVNLAKSTVWVNSQPVNQPASSYVGWTFSASYAGYVSIWVQTSTTDKTYVRLIYSSHGVNYDNQISVGTGGTAIFPILPASSIEIRVGNTNLINGASETVTITYYY